MLDQITPVVLTADEGPNIARTLSHLTWAKDIVVIDSGSTDGTRAILARYPKVRVFTRAFKSHADQWNYAVNDTGIATPWILRLDADYQLSDALVAELSQLAPDETVSAYRLHFDYAIFSRLLISSLYPPNTILVRRGRFSIYDRGHTEGWKIDGAVKALRSCVIHDDWKPVDRWLLSQARYMRRELDFVRRNKGGLRNWLRSRPPLMPIIVFFYCLFGKGLLFNGRAGLFYALQRTVAEAILCLLALEQKLMAAANASHEASSRTERKGEAALAARGSPPSARDPTSS